MPEPIVLVVDDEPNVVRLCQRLLERASFQVIATTSSSQALAILARQQVDILLVDIRMPGLDGFQLLTLARHHHPELAAVVMTGYGTVDTAISALQQGADSLILKPFVGAELVQTVQRALQESEHKRDVMRLRALRPLFKITETLLSETDPARLERLIIETVAGHLRCSCAGLFQPGMLEGDLQLVAWEGDLSPTNLCELNQDLLNWLILQGLPVLVNRDGPGDEDLQALLSKFQLGSVMSAPVLNKGGKGILLAGRRIADVVFRDADLEMFAILARQAAIAMENARLYTELRSYTEQVEESRHALNRAEKMAAAGRLTASIAHEINNPLQSLHNCLHLAGRIELSSEDRQKYLQMAQGELDRLMSTVQRMLDFYRPGVRDRKLTDVNELVSRVAMLLEPQFFQNRITVQTHLDSDLPQVMVVASQIQQVLLNLLINSMEAMPEGGEIVIETTPYRSSGVIGAQAGVIIQVEDTGPGIPESERDSIFEPFESTKESGTGLGLPVSYGIVAAHGGALSLIDGRGKGACFRISLPVGVEDESQDIGG